MNRFEIVSDTSHDLPEYFTKDNNVKSVSFYLRLNDDNYLQDQVDITRRQLYDYLSDNPDVYPKTSLPSVEDYMSCFREHLEEEKDIICFTVSSTLSGSFQSANVAAGILSEDYPDRTIYVIDAESASLGVGLLIKKAVELRDANVDIHGSKEILVEKAKTTEVYIALDTLSYLQQGGRISRTGALAGDLLKIKPIASFKNNTLNLETAVRGNKRANKKVLELLDDRIKDDPNNYEVYIIHGDTDKRASEVKDIIEEKYNIDMNFDIALVSPAVISHIGPGAIGIVCSKII